MKKQGSGRRFGAMIAWGLPRLAGLAVWVAPTVGWGYSAIQNKADNTEIRIVPTPGEVTIDGDLSDTTSDF